MWSGLYIGEAISQVCWGWLHIKGIPAVLKSVRCTWNCPWCWPAPLKPVLQNVWSRYSGPRQDCLCGDSYSNGPYPDMVHEVAVTCAYITWASIPDPPPPQWAWLPYRDHDSARKKIIDVYIVAVLNRTYWCFDSRNKNPSFPESELMLAWFLHDWIWALLGLNRSSQMDIIYLIGSISWIIAHAFSVHL